MGLFTSLLTLPLAPVRGVVWVAEQLAAEAERERSDPQRLRRELAALELAYEEGVIGEDERRERELELLDAIGLAEAVASWGEVGDA